MIGIKQVSFIAPLAAAVALALPAESKTIKLTVVAGAPPTVSNVKATKEIFLPEINKRLAASGQDFKIEWVEAYSSTLAKLEEVLETVEEGIGQVAVVLKNFEESKLPLDQYMYVVPFTDQTPLQAVEIDSALRSKIPELNQAYDKHNHYFLLSSASSGMDLFTTFPVKSIDDLKGHKIGASGAMGHYLQNTGATLVTSAMMESYTNIRNGVYDGYIVSVGIGVPLRTYEAAKHHTVVNFGSTATTSMTLNKDAWKQLPDFAKKIFHESAVVWSNGINKIDEDRETNFRRMMKQKDVTTTPMAPAERRRWAITLPNLAQQWADAREKEGLPGKRVIAAYMDELRARNIGFAREWDKE